MSVPPDVNGNLGPYVPGETIVILMRVRNDHSEQAAVRCPEPVYGRKQVFVAIVGSVEREADIEHDALSSRFHLDAGPANFLRSSDVCGLSSVNPLAVLAKPFRMAPF